MKTAASSLQYRPGRFTLNYSPNFVSLIIGTEGSFTTFGRTYSIREAWLERFGLRNEDGTPYQDNFYFLCFSLEKIPSPIPETEVIRSVQFRDAQNEQRVVEGYGSSKTTKKKGVFRIKQETDHLIVYGFPCKTTAKRIDLKVEGYQLSPDSLYEKQITPTDVTLTITIPEQFEKLPSGEGNAHPHTKTVTQIAYSAQADRLFRSMAITCSGNS